MKILRLELYGYNRLMLNNIKHFIYTPNSTHQLILGTNGSGKSSILSELSPLPAHHSNYAKDKSGFKKITIFHAGRTYQLNSIFKTNKHSFVVEDTGEDLNPGGTAEAQKELVFQHFGINKDIHDIITGEQRLTLMGPGERRKWITMISRSDYGFAMSTFKKFAGRARDQQGALKHLNQRLTQEINNLQSLQGLDGLEERSIQLREELNYLMLERIPNLPKLEIQQGRLRQLVAQVEAQSRDYFKAIGYMPAGKSYKSEDDVQFDIQRLDTNIHASQALIERMGNEYGDMEAVVNSVQVEAGESLEDLPELILLQQRDMERLRSELRQFTSLNSPSEILRDWNSIGEEVQILFRRLPDNRERIYSRENVQRKHNEKAEQQRIIDNSGGRINAIMNRLALMQEAKEEQCPSCNYIWRPGFSETEMAQLKYDQEQHGQIIDAARVKMKEIEAFIEECAEITSMYNQFRGFVQGFPRLQPLWDYILEHQLHLNDPKSNLQVFQDWRRDLDLSVQYEAAHARYRHYLDLTERQTAMGDTAHFSRRMFTLQKEIEEATQKLLEQRTERKTVDHFYAKLSRMQSLALEIEQACQDIETVQGTLVDSLRNDVIDETVMTLQTELGGIMRKLSEKEGQEGIVRDLETSKAEVALDAKALQLITQALSPNEGLIAEQLASDIGCLVAQLNSVIASIWTYDFTVLSCGMDSGELDYKFPVQFATADYGTPDIGKTSKGQRQVIDFAFQLTVMLYLNLTDYPLFLDEPGEGFDEQHRIKLMDFVKQLMEMGRHSQLFMISHYASSHGSFVNAEVLVLDASNISVPGNYNQHATLA